MAKINAHGAVKVDAGVASSGIKYLLRSDGAILHKLLPTDGWSIFKRFKTLQEARVYFYRLLEK